MNSIDHFVYFHSNLHEGISYFESQFGLKAEIGGQHLGRGTWNAIFALENDMYFEIISPDPKQLPFKKRRWMGLDYFTEPQLIRWALAVDNLELAVNEGKNVDISLGKIEKGNRNLLNGEVLQWQLTTPSMKPHVELTPFLIEWRGNVHPSNNKKPQAKIKELTLKGDPKALKESLNWLNIDVSLETSVIPQIVLVLETEKGLIKID